MFLRKSATAIGRCMFAAVFCVVGFTNYALAEYKLKPGDTIELTVWQEPKLNRSLIVAPDGTISVPLVGQVAVAGLSVSSLAGRLQTNLSSQYNGELDVSVALAKMAEERLFFENSREKAANNIFHVTGEVQKPGEYKFEESTTILQGIATAGGLGPFAAGKRIVLRRKVNGEERLHEFDYESFVSGEDMQGNVTLKKGDVIIVPEKRFFE
jgi:polysaccharide biosynthesis/export protein